MKIVAILLAAGAGSRFGGGKLLHPLSDGIALGVRSASALVASGLAVTAVVKPGDEPLAALLEANGCAVTVCPNAARGMGASLAHGVSACRDADGWVVALADMPRLDASTIRAVADALAAGHALVAPRYRGKRGHPVGISARFRDQLLSLDGDVGARDIVADHASELKLIDVDDPGVLLDIDRKEDIR